MIRSFFVFYFRDFGVEPLIQNLENLWSTFLESISSNLKDYVTLGHLGMILQILSEKGKRKYIG